MTPERVPKQPDLTSDPLISQFLLHAEPGQAAAHRVLIDEGMVTVFIIREDEEHVEALPAQPMIEVRSAVLIEDRVGLVVHLARIEGEIYETWFNRYFEGIGLAECLDDLSQQEKLLFSFYVGDPEPVRTIWMPNVHRGAFARALRLVSEMEPWSMEAFDGARAKLFQHYPSVQALWKACESEGE